jgi:competence protein ComEC
LRVLALAVIVLVLVDPFLVHSIGFRLSCAASAGIVVLAPALAARLPGPRCVREPLAVTAAAQLGVAPVALPTFGGLSLVALPANLLAAPAAVALTVWGLASGFVGGLLEAVSPGASVPLQLPTGVLATYIAGVASLAARFPMTMTPRGALGVVTVGALVTAGFLTFRRRGPAPSRGANRATPGPVPGAPRRAHRRR